MPLSSRPSAGHLVSEEVHLRLILVSGKTQDFTFSPNDSATDIAKHVFDNWPEGWEEERVSSPSILRLIFQGRFLHGNVTLGALKLPPGRTTVMHLVARETLPEPNSHGGHLPLRTVPASYKHNGSVCAVTKGQCGKDFGQTPSDEDPTPLGVTVRTCRCSGVTPCWASQRQQEEQVKMRGEERQPKTKDSSLWNPLLVKSTTAAGGWIHCVADMSPARVQPVRGVLQRAAVQPALIAGGHVCTSPAPDTQAPSPDPDFGRCSSLGPSSSNSGGGGGGGGLAGAESSNKESGKGGVLMGDATVRKQTSNSDTVHPSLRARRRAAPPAWLAWRQHLLNREPGGRPAGEVRPVRRQRREPPSRDASIHHRDRKDGRKHEDEDVQLRPSLGLTSQFGSIRDACPPSDPPTPPSLSHRQSSGAKP
ncbi:Ubiquitin-like protein 3 [Takifugu flavidus]|uniref:Ubiquitin-like protein 3 n=1 Tax=Takifugu flavidus TaxID=433684 RepID=A0A5C6MQN0_9TELE|nr:Ubiquitin-like protein 3 [Takifugu flavidus]